MVQRSEAAINSELSASDTWIHWRSVKRWVDAKPQPDNNSERGREKAAKIGKLHLLLANQVLGQVKNYQNKEENFDSLNALRSLGAKKSKDKKRRKRKEGNKRM